MPTILDTENDVVTVINTFMVEPSRADELLALLENATVNGMSQLQGFISANFHMSEDRTSIINYAQWRSVADIEAMLANPEARQQISKFQGAAQAIKPVFCRLRSTYGAGA